MAFTKTAGEGVTISVSGQSILAEPGTFGTGSRGYLAAGQKVIIGGKRYQVTMNLVEIGSKPEAGPKGPEVVTKPPRAK